VESRLSRRTAASGGFTLIEMLVVVALVVILLGMIGLRIGGATRDVRTEAERLAAVIQAAQEQALLGGVPLALRLTGDGYAFDTQGADRNWVEVVQDDVLRPRRFARGVEMDSAMIEESPAASGARLMLPPSGDWLPFSLTLRRSDERWQVKGGADGEIKVAPAGTRGS